ncbi:MAG: DUF5411 family protein [bacterium]|nr:DUF5411 family protein [bacterium]
MKWSFATIGAIMLGLTGLSVIVLFQNLTTKNEQDYYLIKEVTEASMLEAVDKAYYRSTGELKISQEKFVENFTRRYIASATYDFTGYSIEFYDIIESPPKVSIRIINKTNVTTKYQTSENDQFDIVNQLDAILYMKS